MASAIKLEIESETCAICSGNFNDLLTADEYDASSSMSYPPLRTMLLQLNNNKTVPEGRYCNTCIRRAVEAYDFSSTLSSRVVLPLSERIRTLRRKLYELTKKIDVFIVVGGAAAGQEGSSNYNEDDIIMVDRSALAAAVAMDDGELPRARDARGDHVYQCSQCPLSFQRVSEYRAHSCGGGEGSHSCWTCGAVLSSAAAWRDHARQHRDHANTTCHLCHAVFQNAATLRTHESSGTCASGCPACGATLPSRRELSAHCASRHHRGAPPPHVCPLCFLTATGAPQLTAHLLQHRHDKQYLCGYDGCLLRFPTRSNLLSHLRLAHAGAAPGSEAVPAQDTVSVACAHCSRTFGSVAAMKRHARVHRTNTQQDDTWGEEMLSEPSEGEAERADEGEVEYLELESLDEELLARLKTEPGV